jgi:hypothetical protein
MKTGYDTVNCYVATQRLHQKSAILKVNPVLHNKTLHSRMYRVERFRPY